MDVPAELRVLPQWVCWRREQRAGKPTKVPVDPHTGEFASSTDPATWSGLDDAVGAAKRLGCDGVGFVFSEGDPYAGIDLDDCIDEEGDDLGCVARQIVDDFTTYTEISPSGRGLHCILRGTVPAVARKQAVLDGQKVEVYSAGRYFCMTGDSITDDAPIRDAQPQLEALCERLKTAARARDNGGTKLGEGEGRNNELTRRLGLEVARGVTGAELRRRALELNDFGPPLPDDEVDRILCSAQQWLAGEEGPALVSEAAHAAVLENAWLGHYRWAHHEGSWRRWNGRVWEKQAEPVVVAAAQKVLRHHYAGFLAQPQGKAEDERLHALHRAACRYASVLGGLAFLKGADGFHTEVAQWDAEPYLLNCADGILDLRTQTLGPHDPAALCTKITTWPFGATAVTGAWQRHLELCLPNPAVRRQVQRDLGRALVAADLEESLPIWHGSGANGKSTTERAIQRGLGDYARLAVRNLLVASKQERHPTEIADLAGARLVFADEIERGKRLDEALVKELTGGGRKKARYMRCDNFEFEQTFTIFFSVNHCPEITGSDRGIWRRIRLVPWSVEIPEQRPQEEMVAELVADGAWMLRWMVAGFADWQADHHWVAEEVRAATEAYQADQDRLAGFLEDACERKTFAQISVGELHDAYAGWCESSGEERLGKIAFGKQLKERGFAQTKDGDGTRIWKGLRLRTASDGSNAASPHATSQPQTEPEDLPFPAVDAANRTERTPS